ncbi:hypothetical protein LshimejAT787_0212520 [Lyophyllum shimeji]|uniref:Uncharacterized protein n=1 Tax=Lyophyllum shimeji TaxID=47721 RepID=A0A9P3PHW3_LYOSH|nr:hypothetical protein LshimejAT787_0212520 [Lyophyllum shimeji]
MHRQLIFAQDYLDASVTQESMANAGNDRMCPASSERLSPGLVLSVLTLRFPMLSMLLAVTRPIPDD